MKNLILISALIIIFGFQLSGKKVEEKTALKIAQKVLKENKKSLKNIDKLIPFGINQDTLLYIITLSDDGFIILSGNDVAPPVLGACYNGLYVDSLMPPGLVYLIGKYQYQISKMKNKKTAPSSKTKKEWDSYLTDAPMLKSTSTSVNPILNTEWAQGNGYNKYCPDGCLAGCTAVAMAQILRHWACKLHPTGSNTHDGESANFGQTNYNWKAMPIETSNDYNALLIYHAGVSCNTNYGITNSTSGPERARDAFENYWGISSNVDVKWRSMHLINWKDILKVELDAGRPILYSGGNISFAGHSWVIDGYNSSDQFHCNWGWNGNYNGDFSFGDFDPQDPADELGPYNLIESAIVNIYPNDDYEVGLPLLSGKSILGGTSTVSIDSVSKATRYQWSTTRGTITGTGTSAQLFTNCNASVCVRAINDYCNSYSDWVCSDFVIKSGSISGSSVLCSSGNTYSVTNLPTGANITWSQSDNISRVSPQGSKQCIFKATGSGTAQIVATITTSCGDVSSQNKTVWAGKPRPYWTNPSGIDLYVGGGCPLCLHEITTDNYFRVFADDWSFQSLDYSWHTFSQDICWTTSGNVAVINPCHLGFDTFYCNVSNQCGSSIYFFAVPIEDCTDFFLLLSPNPATEVTTLSIESINNEEIDEISDTEWQLEVYSKSMELKEKKTKLKGKKYQLNTSGWKEDIYLVRVNFGDKILTQKLIVKR